MKKIKLIALALILLSFIAAFYFYQKMPAKMASHWDASGNVNGYMPRFWGLLLVPIISLVFFILFIAIPKIDPLKQNIKNFSFYYDMFILIFTIFINYIYALIIAWNLGIVFNMSLMLVPAFALLFYYLGILIQNSKRNWFIGIRTPWTLSSDAVWDKTHKIGGKLFKISGIIALIGILFPAYSVWFVIIPVLIATFYAIAYSYFEFKKEIKKK
ncbi:MAG: SdpI family protein [Nanoarchaeota archaeon]